MHLSQELAALRIDPKSQIEDQRRVVAARDAWQNAPSTRQLIEQLDRYGGHEATDNSENTFGLDRANELATSKIDRKSDQNGIKFVTSADRLNDYPELSALFSEHGRAAAFAQAWLRPMLDAMREAPLGHSAFRHMHYGENTVVQLFRSGRAELSLVLIASDEPLYLRAQQNLIFTDSERHEVVIAGSALIRLVERSGPNAGPAHFAYQEMDARSGAIIHRSGPRQSLLVDRVEGCLLRLRLSRTPDRPEPARKYRLSDGMLIHQSAGRRRDSQQEFAMAVLGAMQYRPACPAIAAIATGNSPIHLRWEALRQGLALDTGSGFAALCSVANNPKDPLFAYARKLRAALAAKHAELEELLCPA